MSMTNKNNSKGTFSRRKFLGSTAAAGCCFDGTGKPVLGKSSPVLALFQGQCLIQISAEFR